MKRITVANNQNLIDLCMQYAGTADYLVRLVNINNLPGYDFLPKPGSTLLIDDPIPNLGNNNLNIAAWYQKYNIQVVQGVGYSQAGVPIITQQGQIIRTPGGRVITI
jgi:hypothetical protein